MWKGRWEEAERLGSSVRRGGLVIAERAKAARKERLEVQEVWEGETGAAAIERGSRGAEVEEAAGGSGLLLPTDLEVPKG